MSLTVLALNCTLKRAGPSSTEKLLGELLTAFREYDAEGEILRVLDFDIKAGVSSDEGRGDHWPELRKRVLACDILAVGFTIPTGGVTYWVGEAMGDKNYIDLKETPKAVAQWTPVLASNAAHLAKLLKGTGYPGRKTSG